MLVLTRKANEQIQIGDNVVITILQVKGQSVRVGIEAPREIRVLRSELPRTDEIPFENPMTEPLGRVDHAKSRQNRGALPRALLKSSPLLASAPRFDDTCRALSTFTVGSLSNDGFGESRRQTSRCHRAAANRTGCKCNGRRLGLRGLGALSPL